VATAAFASEADMLAPIAEGLSRSLWRRHPRPDVLFEFDVSSGVADIVGVEFDSSAIIRRDFVDLAPVVQGVAVRTLVALRPGPMDTARLADAVAASPTHLRRSVLPTLIDTGWVARSPTGEWEALIQHQTVIRRAIAVEAKLKDWRTALWQANRHRRFANLTVVVLDATTRTDAALAAVRHFEDVGLATIAADNGSFELLHLPGWQLPISISDFALAGERAWDMHRLGRVTRSAAPVFGRDLRAMRGVDPRFPDAGERSRQ